MGDEHCRVLTGLDNQRRGCESLSVKNFHAVSGHVAANSRQMAGLIGRKLVAAVPRGIWTVEPLGHDRLRLRPKIEAYLIRLKGQHAMRGLGVCEVQSPVSPAGLASLREVLTWVGSFTGD